MGDEAWWLLMGQVDRGRGFSLLELMVTIAVLGLLLSFAVPGLSKWVNNNKVRSVADQLQNGIRLAQNEALRRSHQVVFALTTTQTGAFTASTSGPYWVVQTIPFLEGEVAETIETGALVGLNGRVAVAGPTTGQICFNAVGRLTANSSTGIGGSACTAAIAQYNISLTGVGSDTPLQINVGLSGQVHMCNPTKTLSDTAPDGC